MKRIDEIVSDEDVTRVHGHANFGNMTPREALANGVWKYSMGYSSGYTQLTILREHGLITKPKPGSYKADLTVKGKAYLRALHPADPSDLAARIADLERQLAEARGEYRKGWRFAYNQWDRTGSVPNPDYTPDPS